MGDGATPLGLLVTPEPFVYMVAIWPICKGEYEDEEDEDEDEEEE
jgi:hypothetical protein